MRITHGNVKANGVVNLHKRVLTIIRNDISTVQAQQILCHALHSSLIPVEFVELKTEISPINLNNHVKISAFCSSHISHAMLASV